MKHWGAMVTIMRMEGPGEVMGLAGPTVLATGAIRGLLSGSWDRGNTAASGDLLR